MSPPQPEHRHAVVLSKAPVPDPRVLQRRHGTDAKAVDVVAQTVVLDPAVHLGVDGNRPVLRGIPREQPVAQKPEIQDGDPQQRQPDQGKFKKGKTFKPVGGEGIADDDVGRRTGEGQEPAGIGSEGQWQQQLGRVGAGAPCMKHSTKGSTEKRRLTEYLCTVVLDDNYKGTTHGFILHFQEQFRKLDSLTAFNDQMSYDIRLTLLQKAVAHIPELAIVATLDEYNQVAYKATGSRISYDKYFDLLEQACIKYDNKVSNNSVRRKRNIYNHHFHQDDDENPETNDYFEIEDSFMTSPDNSTFSGIDIPAEEYYQIHSSRFNTPRNRTPSRPFKKSNSFSTPPRSNPQTPTKKYDGPVYLPKHIYQLIGKQAQDALAKYNQDAIARYQSSNRRSANVHEVSFSSDQHDHPSPENGEPMQVDTPVKSDQEPDLHIPSEDPIMDMVSGQDISNHQFDQVINAYQTRHSTSPSSTSKTAKYKVNIHKTYRITQAHASSIASLIDRGANGGLAGADVRVLSRTLRKVSVTGIGEHEISGLDIVNCASLVNTNLGIIVLIMNEYAYYGRGNSIHASAQIEHFKNQVDDRSVKVGGKQSITLLDGECIPLECKGGLIYMNFIGKPTGLDMEKISTSSSYIAT